MYKFSFTVLFSIVLTSCSMQDNSQNLAEIGSYELSVQQFQDSFKEFYIRTGKSIPVNSVSKKSIFENEFYPLVLAHRAKLEGLDKSEKAKLKANEIENRLLVEFFINDEVLDSVSVSDKEAREFFMRSKTYWNASHLFAKTKKEADSLKLLLDEGVDFDRIAKNTFKTPYLANQGGNVGSFTVDEMDLAFEDMVAEMNEGEISEPVQTAYGYSIIKLNSRNTEPIITEQQFIVNKGIAKTLELKRKRIRANDKFLRETLEKLNINKYLLSDVVYNLWHGVSESPESKYNNKDKDLKFSEKLIASKGGFDITVRAIIDEVERLDESEMVAVSSKEKLYSVCEGIVVRNYIAFLSKNKEIHLKNEFNKIFEIRFTEFLASLLEETILDTIKVAQEQIHNYYQNNKSNFKTPVEYRLQRIVVSSKSDAEKVYGFATGGKGDFEELVYAHSRNNEDLMTGGDMGFVKATDLGVVANSLIEADLNEVLAPIQYSSNEYHIYKLNDIKPSRYLELFEVVDDIANELKRNKLSTIKKSVLKETMEKENVDIDWDKISKIKVNV